MCSFSRYTVHKVGWELYIYICTHCTLACVCVCGILLSSKVENKNLKWVPLLYLLQYCCYCVTAYYLLFLLHQCILLIIAHYVQIAQATHIILSLCFVCVCRGMYSVWDLSLINTLTLRIERVTQAELDLDIAFGTPGFSISLSFVFTFPFTFTLSFPFPFWSWHLHVFSRAFPVELQW